MKTSLLTLIALAVAAAVLGFGFYFYTLSTQPALTNQVALASPPTASPPTTPTDSSAILGGEEEEMVRNRRITPSQAKELIQKYPDAIILDVREAHEFNACHVPGAVLLPTFDIAYQAQYILPDQYQLILVYCRSGARSRSAKDLLLSMGYVNVYDFGGINAWPYDIVRP